MNNTASTTTGQPVYLSNIRKRICMSTSVLLVDDHPLVRGALRNAIETISEDIVCIPASSLEQACAEISLAHPPDLVILDLNLPDACGTATLDIFRRRYPGLPLAVLSERQDPATLQAAQKVNALGFLPKTASVEQIHANLRHILGIVLASPTSGSASAPVTGTASRHACQPPAIPLADTHRPATSTAQVTSQATELPEHRIMESATTDAGPTPWPILPAPPRRTYEDGRHLGLTERQRCVLKLMMMGLPNKAICRQLHLAEGTVKVHVSAVLRALGVNSRAQVTLAALSCGIRMEAIELPKST